MDVNTHPCPNLIDWVQAWNQPYICMMLLFLTLEIVDLDVRSRYLENA